MMTGSDRDTVLVQYGANIVGVGQIHGEGYNPGQHVGPADDIQAFNLLKFIQRVGQQSILMIPDIFKA